MLMSDPLRPRNVKLLQILVATTEADEGQHSGSPNGSGDDVCVTDAELQPLGNSSQASID